MFNNILIILLTILLLSLLYFIFQRAQAIGSFSLKHYHKKGILQKSKQYRNGIFHNELNFPPLAEGITMKKMLIKFLNGKSKRATPPTPLKNHPFPIIDFSKDQFIWFGHSSYLIIVQGKTILIDPIFSQSISPFGIGLKAFKMLHPYSTKDLPNIDYLIITHDHWDHLDYSTLQKLKPKINHIITSLGVGAHLKKWKFKPQNITELDWWEEFQTKDFKLTATPAQHFAGRWTKRNITLWSSFVLETTQHTIYIGGDSGYGPHFKKIGEQFKIDWAFLENGQYDAYWPSIHMRPDECILAANDLQTKYMVPVHNSKFSLAYHDWDAPLRNITDSVISANFKLITPGIGEVVPLHQPKIPSPTWWTS